VTRGRRARIRVDSVGLDTGLNGEDMARRADQDVTRLHEPAMRVVATYPNYVRLRRRSTTYRTRIFQSRKFESSAEALGSWSKPPAA
jgi:hypothetical protein